MTFCFLRSLFNSPCKTTTSTTTIKTTSAPPTPMYTTPMSTLSYTTYYVMGPSERITVSDGDAQEKSSKGTSTSTSTSMTSSMSSVHLSPPGMGTPITGSSGDTTTSRLAVNESTVMNHDDSSKMSTVAVGVGLGVGLGCLLILAVFVAVICWYRRSKKNIQKTETVENPYETVEQSSRSSVFPPIYYIIDDDQHSISTIYSEISSSKPTASNTSKQTSGENSNVGDEEEYDNIKSSETVQGPSKSNTHSFALPVTSQSNNSATETDITLVENTLYATNVPILDTDLTIVENDLYMQS